MMAHPNRDAEPPQCIPREVQMLQSVTTPKTPRRIPRLCSTTGVCWRESISVAGADAAIRRLLPTSAELCRPPMKMVYSAAIRRLPPTLADQKFLVQNSLCHSLNSGGAERQTGPWVRREGQALSPAAARRGYSSSEVKSMASLMTEQEVSKRLNVSLASLRRWRLTKRGPAFLKVGVLVRYRPEDLDAWLASRPTGGDGTITPTLSS